MGNEGGFFTGIATAFPWIFGAVVVLILGGWVLNGVMIARNARVLRQAGIDPTTAGSQLAVRFLRGQPPAAPVAPTSAAKSMSTAERLAELTDLRDRGLITAEEYQTRRSQIIDSI
jgi:hypothetical protein